MTPEDAVDANLPPRVFSDDIRSAALDAAKVARDWGIVEGRERSARIVEGLACSVVESHNETCRFIAARIREDV